MGLDSTEGSAQPTPRAASGCARRRRRYNSPLEHSRVARPSPMSPSTPARPPFLLPLLSPLGANNRNNGETIISTLQTRKSPPTRRFTLEWSSDGSRRAASPPRGHKPSPQPHAD